MQQPLLLIWPLKGKCLRLWLMQLPGAIRGPPPTPRRMPLPECRSAALLQAESFSPNCLSGDLLLQFLIFLSEFLFLFVLCLLFVLLFLVS